ncbi:MAG: OmpA family protein [Myxococcaceae bacterium]|nr:OmpA family protein [Myxococcaceae bacterium]
MQLPRRHHLVCWVLLAAALTSQPTLAQDRGFRVHRDEVTPAGTTQFLVDRPWFTKTRSFSVGLSGHYALAPLTPRLATGRNDLSPLLTNVFLASFDVAGALFDRLLLSGSLPVTLSEQGRVELVSGAGPLSGLALGDPRVGAMLRLFGQGDRDPISLNVGADVWIPIGGAATGQGDRTARVMPRVVLFGAGGVFRWSLDAGFLFRGYSSIGPPALGLTAASEARVGVALGLSLFDHVLQVGPEARASTQVVGAQAFSVNGSSLEVLGGAHLLLLDHLLVGVAGGAGFLGAPGTPDARLIVRLSWAPRGPEAPTPPVRSEPPPPVVVPQPVAPTPAPPPTVVVTPPAPPPPATASRDERIAITIVNAPTIIIVNGRPGDVDGDGVLDAVDRCPFEPETVNEVRDGDGCPELALEAEPALKRVLQQAATRMTPASPSTPVAPAPSLEPVKPVDSDGDGVADDLDRCPATAEDADGFEDEDGCPENDNDRDFVPDVADRCPMEAETLNGFEDDDGCPDASPDADEDGVSDIADRCPFEAETRNGVRDDDGCPEVAVVQPALAATAATPIAPDVLPAASATVDSDADGITDDADRCPLDAEDRDGFEDEDGCPELDDDGDGIADAKDRCPAAAETFNGFEDADGCPDVAPDADGDGFAFTEDRCPLEAGGPPDGCPRSLSTAAPVAVAVEKPTEMPSPPSTPPSDTDGDGVMDSEDACPRSAEDRDGFEDDDGCPETDNDGDGVLDPADKCPFVAETINGVKDEDGCPDVGASAVSIVGDHVVLEGVVRFRSGSATLEPSALPLLKQVASTLKAARSLSVEIQGHTDDVGSAFKNVKLSQKRAEAIRAVLVKAGVAATRLVAKGYGPTRPRASNATPAGREQNRRVEFLILGEPR